MQKRLLLYILACTTLTINLGANLNARELTVRSKASSAHETWNIYKGGLFLFAAYLLQKNLPYQSQQDSFRLLTTSLQIHGATRITKEITEILHFFDAISEKCKHKSNYLLKLIYNLSTIGIGTGGALSFAEIDSYSEIDFVSSLLIKPFYAYITGCILMHI